MSKWFISFVLVLALLLAVMANAADPDLVAHWKLDDGSGTTAVDSSANGNDGTFVGDPQWASGILGGALDFDGVDDYVDCGNDEIFFLIDRFVADKKIFPREDKKNPTTEDTPVK